MAGWVWLGGKSAGGWIGGWVGGWVVMWAGGRVGGRVCRWVGGCVGLRCTSGFASIAAWWILVFPLLSVALKGSHSVLKVTQRGSP